MRLTRRPRASRRQPMEAAARPLPREDTTPPVTKMYFADMSATSLNELEVCAWCARLSMAGFGAGGNGEGLPRVLLPEIRGKRDYSGIPREILLTRNSWKR